MEFSDNDDDDDSNDDDNNDDDEAIRNAPRKYKTRSAGPADIPVRSIGFNYAPPVHGR